MNRYQKLFNTLKNNKEGAFFPFVLLGDPTPKLSIKIIEALVEGGADGLELGMPFSDPLSDGPIIQKSNLRAFNAGITVEKCFNIITKIRYRYPKLPIGLLMYANLVFSNGIENFYSNCHKVDIDSILVADIPIEEAKVFIKTSLKYDINQVFICPPDSNVDLLRKISKYSCGYIYLLSRTGVTGTEKHANLIAPDILNKLRSYNSAPLVQGFGISNINQVKKIIKAGVDGVIVGSAIIKIIENYFDKIDVMIKEIKIIAKNFKSASINS
ncbi:tryptophan synthase subunit alpha [Candidatus Pantoea edessiphila]|uniref:Tryptophan synthase alpha chain n=1 Tax=Candidatus Pantoea edessiphila TaxID=2044610 RepID=A0A2P5T2P8_9GAMM|nr:tryptophan synthase subunit alpha [Candidatus Pantoea edessiphila]PPI88833.1 tryptophan synthase subunit alpha [Candidatus Pantoea edessiphila]